MPYLAANLLSLGDMEVKIIDAHLTYDLRHRVLRPNQDLTACHYPLDFELSSLHVGAYSGTKLISVASYFKENHPDLMAPVQYRLRGMATDPEFRNRGAGSALIRFSEDFLILNKVSLWWCNARISAATYYEKHGLSQLGETFDLPPIGPHKVMVKSFD